MTDTHIPALVERSGDLSATPTGGRWLVGFAAALAVAVGTVAALGGPAGPGEPAKKGAEKGGDTASKEKEPAFEIGRTPTWKWGTIKFPLALAEVDEGAKWLEALYAKTIEARRKAGRPMIPPAVPALVGNQLVYSDDFGVSAFELAEDENAGVRKGEFRWNQLSDTSLAFYANHPGPRWSLDSFLAQSPDQAAELLWNRTLSESFTSDREFVYSADDLGILPPRYQPPKGEVWPGTMPWPEKAGILRDAINLNAVRSVDRSSGKITVKLKGKLFLGDKPSPVGPTLYLGPPFPIGDLLVLPHEADRHFRLTALRREPLLNYHRRDWKGTVQDVIAWDTDLLTAPQSAREDTHRRIHAIHLTQAGDLIVCPTHLSRVVAVDAKTGKVRWTQEYAPLDAKRFPTFAPEWVVVPPVVAGDRYVYAPADFPELLCLNVADGKKVWGAKKGDGLYPAVVGERVLVVGEKTIRSLSLKDGSEQWKADLPGLPCGRGAVLGDTYLLPVSEPKTWKGLIAVVEVATGKVVEVLRPEKDEPIGNLVVHKDYLISQTLTEIAVYPIKKRN